ncbi:MAG TPA: GNAT family N-acetyltransferase [Hanamia sp.]|nr:GNAT family N-acetyltransferase [Hanamia sp.]
MRSLPDLQPAGWGDITPAFQFYTSSEFCFPLKVIIDNKIIGIGAAIIHNDVAWMGHIIVHPDLRNKGIGKKISQALVDLCKTKHCETIYLIATDPGAPIYESIGFETETQYLFFKDIKIDSPFLTSQSIVPFEEKYRKHVIAMDKNISGENRIHHLEQHFSKGYIFKNGEKIEGYFLPTFGEGLIIANNPKAGIELMKFRFISKENASLPVDNSDAINFLKHNNIKEFRSAKRMRLGIEKPWLPANIYNRIGGHLG